MNFQVASWAFLGGRCGPLGPEAGWDPVHAPPCYPAVRVAYRWVGYGLDPVRASGLGYAGSHQFRGNPKVLASGTWTLGASRQCSEAFDRVRGSKWRCVIKVRGVIE